MPDRNVLGGQLEPCGTEPLTGFYRDGCCSTGPEDLGSHTICAVVTSEFLAHQRSIGNDLSTPVPQYRFPGLVPGDRWCVTVANWLRAHREGFAAPVVLASTHERALDVVPLKALRSTPSTCPTTWATCKQDDVRKVSRVVSREEWQACRRFAWLGGRVCSDFSGSESQLVLRQRHDGTVYAITVSHPPAAILRVANPILRFLLRTPVMGAARKQLMVVSFNGRKTGRQYTIPLSAHRVDNDLYALTAAPWQRNFRDGAAAEVFHDGKTTTMHGELIQDRSVVADLYRRCSESYGVKGAQRMIGLKFRDQRIPTLEEFTEAIERDHWPLSG